MTDFDLLYQQREALLERVNYGTRVPEEICDAINLFDSMLDIAEQERAFTFPEGEAAEPEGKGESLFRVGKQLLTREEVREAYLSEEHLLDVEDFIGR